MIANLVRIALSVCLSIAVAPLLAQDTAKPVPFPQDPAAWVNSRPLTSAALEGKSAILWFFEEDCPRCRERWPGLLEAAKKFEGQPVMFIAINSGTPRPELEAYLRGVGCTWPTICDPTREFEKACDVGEISLMNIYQMKVLTARGELRNGDWQNIDATVERALSGAKWTVDPAQVPASLKTTWACIEFGQCSAAAAPLKKALTSGKSDVKEAANLLNAAVRAKIAKGIEEAKQEAAADRKWSAYKLYQSLTVEFAGYDIPADALQAKKELSEHEAIKKELAAAKTLETIQKSIRGTSASAQRTAETKLKKLIQDSAGTEAAEKAQALLDKNT